MLAKRGAEETNTSQAQGGIASVLREDDSFLSHIDDTLKAGGGLCKAEVVEAVVKEGPERIATWCRWGVRFTRAGKAKDSPFDLTREGGHSARRILHRADLTGAEIQRALTARARRQPLITLLEWQQAVDLISLRGQVLGAYVLDTATGEVVTHLAKATVLATGGWSKAYLYTTNPDVASGDGLAMAWRAGAKVANLEFCQFHPTCLYHPDAKRFLISESVRGEGGILRDRKGKAFMRPLPSPARSWPPATSSPGPSTPCSRHRRRVRLPRRHPPSGRLDPEALPPHPRDLPALRHRHDQDAHPGRAGRPLPVRRRRRRAHGRTQRGAPLCRGRGRLHRPARGQPPRQQQPA